MQIVQTLFFLKIKSELLKNLFLIYLFFKPILSNENQGSIKN